MPPATSAATPVSSMVLFLIAAIVGALGQFLYKSGAERTTDVWLSYMLNWRLAIGVVCYIGVMVLFQAGIFGSDHNLRVRSVRMKPGAIPLTRTPCLPHSSAMPRVMLDSPDLLIP